MGDHLQWDQRDRGLSIPCRKRENILWLTFHACAELVLDTSAFSTSNKEGEKEGGKIMTEKEFNKSLLSLIELIKKLRKSILGEIKKEKNDEKEVENDVVDSLSMYLITKSSLDHDIEENKNNQYQLGGSTIEGGDADQQSLSLSPSMLSPDWLKYISLTVRTVISWCTLLLLSALDTHPSVPLPPSPPLSLPSFVKEGMWKARKELQVTIGKKGRERERSAVYFWMVLCVALI